MNDPFQRKLLRKHSHNKKKQKIATAYHRGRHEVVAGRRHALVEAAVVQHHHRSAMGDEAAVLAVEGHHRRGEVRARDGRGRAMRGGAEGARCAR